MVRRGKGLPPSNIPSPCIKVCTLIDNYCIGCGRHQDEIREWFIATDQRKIEILKRVERDKNV